MTWLVSGEVEGYKAIVWPPMTQGGIPVSTMAQQALHQLHLDTYPVSFSSIGLLTGP